MKKRFAAILLSLLMTATAAMAETSEDVEIKFKVGESVLLINGNEVEVETPYIAGEGTTLVPLRVITEAFGTEVGWNGETKEITLEYPDVSIVMTIDKAEVTVNDHVEVMDVPATLSENGVTMVPLRFISETFGAEVGWDAETSGITVTKKALAADSELKGVIDSERITDSYYGWSMDTPEGLTMTDRSFAGTETVFKDGDETITIAIDPDDESIDINKIFTDLKSLISAKATLQKADKGKDASGVEYFHLKGKTSEFTNEIKCFRTNGKIFLINTMSKENSNKISALIDSFTLTVDKDAYDLSTVENGYRKLNDENLGISILIPQDWYDVDLGGDNAYTFFEFTEGPSNDRYIALEVVSVSEGVSAKRNAEHDYKSNTETLNPDLCTVEPVEQINIQAGVTEAYRYSFASTRANGKTSFLKDIFFEKDGYVYNLAIRMPIEYEKKANYIISSIELGTPNAEELGTIIRDEYTDETYVAKSGDWSVEIPMHWEAEYDYSKELFYISGTKDIGIFASVIDTGAGSNKGIKTVMVQLESEARQEGDEIILSTSPEEIDGKQYYMYTSYDDSDEEAAYYCVTMMTKHGNDVLWITCYIDEIDYSEKTLEQLYEIIATITVK